MGLTVSNLNFGSEGNQYKVSGTLAFDNSYPTGGESVTAADIRLSNIKTFEIKGDEAGYAFDPSIATGGGSVTIKVYQGAAGTTSSTSAGTPAGTVSTPVFTGNALAGHNHTFTGVAVLSSTYTVTHDGAPGGNILRLAYSSSGLPFIECNNAVATATEFLTIGTGKLAINHNGGAAGPQIYIREASNILVCDNTLFSDDAYVMLTDGTVMFVTHDAAAGGAGDVAVNYDDTDNRLEATFTNASNHDIGTLGGFTYLTGTPAGTISSVSAGTPAGTNSTPTFTGDALAGHTHNVGAAAGAEVSNGADLSALTTVEFEATGL